MERLSREFDLTIKWLAYPLHPNTPNQGASLEELFAGRGLDIPAVMTKLEGVARKLELPFGKRTMTYNSRPAQELGKWAEDMGRGHEFHMAAFRAYFVEGQNLAATKVLHRLLTDLGLDPDQGLKALEQGDYSQAVDQDWDYSLQCGIKAVPTFMAGGERLVGSKPYVELAALVSEAGAMPKA